MATSELPGVKVLIEGPTGTGKTYALGTLVDAGLTLHYFPFEAGAESLRGYWTDRGKPIPPTVHFHPQPLSQASWKEMADVTKSINTLPYDLLKKTSDPNRSKYDGFEKFLRAFISPVSADGEAFPPTDEWGTGRVIAIDGLTGLGVAAQAAVIGGKVDRDQKDFGLAMGLIEGTLRRLCDACRCHVVLLAHIEKEPDPLGGPPQITVATLGQKLAPKIPPMFSDVVMSKRLATNFTWSTIEAGADLKARNLPLADKLPQDFGQVIAKWKSRGGLIEPV